jgi:hypothetical protein
VESPRHLIEQAAKEKGISPNLAKRVLYLGALGEDRTLAEAVQAMGCAKSTVQMLCRRFMIDLADYRPYAALEKKGLPRPAPTIRDIHQPASGLPLFSA